MDSPQSGQVTSQEVAVISGVRCADLLGAGRFWEFWVAAVAFMVRTLPALGCGVNDIFTINRHDRR